MAEHILNRTLRIDLPQSQVFEFFTDANNLQKMCPDELDFTILTAQPIEIKKGTILDYQLKLRGIPFKWKTLISDWNPPYSFVDRSLKGPYKQWIHRHTFAEDENGGTLMKDYVRYRLPLEPLGDLGNWLVKRELKYIFDFRSHAVLRLPGLNQ